MIHPMCPFPISALASQQAQPFTAMWNQQLLTWWWSHIPFASINPERNAEILMWDEPNSIEDSVDGIIGDRSRLWHPARTKTENELGMDGKDFMGIGVPSMREDPDEITEW